MPDFSMLSSCSTRLCDYSIFKSVSGADSASCSGGGGTCATARMLTTNALPNIHDGHLKGASTAIQNILRGLEQHANGRKLKFLNMADGVMLGWVDHEALTSAEDPATIAKALSLMEAPAEEAPTSAA